MSTSAPRWRRALTGTARHLALRLRTPRLRSFWRLLRDFTGDRAYEQYLEHRAAAHPDTPALSEKHFWRLRTDTRPPSGCC